MDNTKKISELKKELVKINKEYHLKVYKILMKIYALRLRHNKKYTIMGLSKETIIRELFNYDYINTIMQIRKITPKTKKLIEQGHFTYFEVANTLRSSKRLAIPKEQDRFFEKIIKNNITVSKFREAVTRYNSCNGRLKKRLGEEDIWRLRTVYQIRTIKRLIFKRYNRLDDLNKARIDREISELHYFILSGEEQKKYSLLPIKKKLLKKIRDAKIKGIWRQEQTIMVEKLIEKALGRWKNETH